jgi:hypothetical protein
MPHLSLYVAVYAGFLRDKANEHKWTIQRTPWTSHVSLLCTLYPTGDLVSLLTHKSIHSVLSSSLVSGLVLGQQQYSAFLHYCNLISWSVHTEGSHSWEANKSSNNLAPKLAVFYGTLRFIKPFTRARHLSLFWARSIQSLHHPTF